MKGYYPTSVEIQTTVRPDVTFLYTSIPGSLRRFSRIREEGKRKESDLVDTDTSWVGESGRSWNAGSYTSIQGCRPHFVHRLRQFSCRWCSTAKHHSSNGSDGEKDVFDGSFHRWKCIRTDGGRTGTDGNCTGTDGGLTRTDRGRTGTGFRIALRILEFLHFRLCDSFEMVRFVGDSRESGVFRE